MRILLTVSFILISGQADAFCLLSTYKRDKVAEMLEYMGCLIDEQATTLNKQAEVISLIDNQVYEMRIKVMELENDLARAQNRIEELEN